MRIAHFCKESQHTRTFKVLRALPFFQAMCDRDTLEGAVLFNPDLEDDDLLRRWLTYRTPENGEWVRAAPRAQLVRETVRDMLLYGGSPALGTFVDFNVDLVSTSFLASWLGWYGVIPSPDGDLDARSPGWWRKVARERQEQMRSSPLLRQFRADAQAGGVNGSLERLVDAVATGRALRDRLLHGFEGLDRHTISKLAPREYNVILHILAQKRFPERAEDVLHIKTVEDMQQYEGMYRVLRSTSALAAGTGTAALAVRDYVRLKHDALRREKIRLALSPESEDAANRTFWIKNGITLALKSISGAQAGGKMFVIGKTTEKFAEFLQTRFPDWKSSNEVASSVVALVRALYQKSPAQASTAAVALVAALRSRKRVLSSQERLVQKTLISGFIDTFLNTSV